MVGQGARAARAARLRRSGTRPPSSRYWQSVLFFPVGVYILLALGLNVVVGPHGHARPRVRRVLRGRRLHDRQAHRRATRPSRPGRRSPSRSWWRWPPGVTPRRADPAPAGRLPGHRHPRASARSCASSRSNSEQPRRGAAASPASPTPRPLPGLDFGIQAAALRVPRAGRHRAGRLRSSRGSGARASGGRWTAIREDEDAAELMGVPTFKMKLWSFAIGASTGGLGGLDLRLEGRLHQPRHLPAQPVVPHPRRRGPRRPRLHAGRDRRRVRGRLPPRVPPRGRRRRRPARLPERGRSAATPPTSPSTASSCSASRSW